MSKAGRKHRPKWHVMVDSVIYRFVDDPQTIRVCENRIREIELTGTKETMQYKILEGSRGNNNTAGQERYVLELEQAQEQLQISSDRIKLIDRMLQQYFSEEERTFINLFWLSVPVPDRGAVWTRTLTVIHQIGWLRDPDDKRRPGDAFYTWKKRIYQKWWDLLYPDMPQEMGESDYIEYKALSAER